MRGPAYRPGVQKQRSPSALAAALIAVGVGLVASAGLIGWAIGHETRPAATQATSTAPSPSGHSGAGLPAHEFGDPASGAELFVSKGCADCHSYAGKGGTDAPPLDYMAGHLSAREIANMSGTLWNHVPAMLSHFQEEEIPFPTFTDFEMADLVAYLHSKPTGRPAAAPAAPGSEHGAMEAKPAKAGDPARGKSIFTTLGCGSCHTLTAAGTKGTVGPDLDASLAGKSAAYIEQSMLEPNAVIAKGYRPNVMPGFAATLNEQQLADLIAFLARR